MASPAALYRFGESWCDTTTDAGRLMLTIMGGIAEFERGLIRKRTDEGIERAGSRAISLAVPSDWMPAKSGSLPIGTDKGQQSPNSLRNRASASAPSGGLFNPSKPRPNAHGIRLEAE